VLSIGSAGSVLSIGSSGSILSIGAAGSILSVGGAGRFGDWNRSAPDANGGAAPRPHRFTIERGATLLGALALLSALRR
jgi:hypothetical protein